MADTITTTCKKCEEDFDFLPGAGLERMCDECLEKREAQQERLSKIFGWKHFKKAKPFKRFPGEAQILLSSFIGDQIRTFEKENDRLKSLIQ